MKIQNKGAVLVQIAPLFISQPRNQNQSLGGVLLDIIATNLDVPTASSKVGNQGQKWATAALVQALEMEAEGAVVAEAAVAAMERFSRVEI